jgi:hypothetical protein
MAASIAQAPAVAAPPPGVPWRDLAREGRWIAAAAATGFVISAVGAQGLYLARPWIVLALAVAVLPLVGAYARSKRLDVAGMVRHHWLWALARGLFMGAVLVILVLSDDPSPTPKGTSLAFDVVWLGAVYGAAEALLVNMLPMMAAWQVFAQAGLTRTIRGKIAAWLFTIVANLLVTAAYNLGFPEFRGPEISGPIGPCWGRSRSACSPPTSHWRSSMRCSRPRSSAASRSGACST